jgi:Tol biopolymer transport system component
MIAFAAVRQNGEGLWLMDMVTRSEVKLTDDSDRLPRFTADGGSVMFTRIQGGKLSLWRVPVLGGTPRLVVEDALDGDPSPDGTRIAYLTGSADSTGDVVRLMVARSDGTDARALWSLGAVLIGGPRWSPDGKRIAIAVPGGQTRLR